MREPNRLCQERSGPADQTQVTILTFSHRSSYLVPSLD